MNIYRLNMEAITIEDCMEMYDMKGEYSVINNGKLEGFINEKEGK